MRTLLLFLLFSISCSAFADDPVLLSLSAGGVGGGPSVMINKRIHVPKKFILPALRSALNAGLLSSGLKIEAVEFKSVDGRSEGEAAENYPFFRVSYNVHTENGETCEVTLTDDVRSFQRYFPKSARITVEYCKFTATGEIDREGLLNQYFSAPLAYPSNAVWLAYHWASFIVGNE